MVEERTQLSCIGERAAHRCYASLAKGIVDQEDPRRWQQLFEDHERELRNLCS